MASQWNKLTVAALKEELRTRDLSVAGKKPELVARLASAAPAGAAASSASSSSAAAAAAPQKSAKKTGTKRKAGAALSKKLSFVPSKKARVLTTTRSVAASGQTLKLATYNVNGLRAAENKKAVTTLLAAESPDVLCLLEVKCLRSECPSKFPGYTQHWAESKKPGLYGTLVLVRASLAPVGVREGLGASDDEGRCVIVEFSSFFLVATYVPNAGQELKYLSRRLHWNDVMRTTLGELHAQKPVVWTGDLNVAFLDIDVYDGETNKNRKKSAGFTDEERTHFDQLLHEDGFVDVFRHFHPEQRDAWTFWSYRFNMRAKGKGWRLDYFVVSPELVHHGLVSDVRVLSDFVGSDHVPILLELSVPDEQFGEPDPAASKAVATAAAPAEATSG